VRNISYKPGAVKQPAEEHGQSNRPDFLIANFSIGLHDCTGKNEPRQRKV